MKLKRESLVNRIKKGVSGPNGYAAVHQWLHYYYGSADKCENPECVYPRRNSDNVLLIAPKTFHWANKTGKYLKDRNDWLMLCPSCHKHYDGGQIPWSAGKKFVKQIPCQYCKKMFYPKIKTRKFCSILCCNRGKYTYFSLERRRKIGEDNRLRRIKRLAREQELNLNPKGE
jgi:hypothetical protein